MSDQDSDNYDDYNFSDVAPKQPYQTMQYTNPQQQAPMWGDNSWNPGQSPAPPLPMQPPPPGQHAGPGRQKDRVVKAVKPFWIPQTVPFNSVADENVTTNSKSVDFDVFVLGAWTGLGSATVKLSQTNDGVDLSIDPIPIQSIAGNTGQIQPVRWWKPPTFLPAQSTLRGDFVNVGTEAASFINYMTIIRGSETAIRIKRSSRFYVLADLSNASLVSFTSAIEDPLLIWGASGTAGVAASLVQFTDERSNYSWSSQQMIAPSFCGIQGNTQPVIHYPRPYLLNPRARIRTNYDVAVNDGSITFLCERLLDYDLLPQIQHHQPAQGLTDKQKQQALQQQQEQQARRNYLQKQQMFQRGRKF